MQREIYETLENYYSCGCGIRGGYTSVHAQDSLIGKYSGTYTATTAGRQWGLDLNIISVDNGTVKGTALRYGRECRGDFQLEGTYKENQLVLRSNAGGAAGDCRVDLRLVSEGNNLKGTMGSFPIQLSK